MRTLVLVVPAEDAELAADRLWAAGARAVEERDAAVGRVGLHTVLAEADAVSLERLGPIPAGWSVEFVDVDDEPAQTWREFARPIVVNDRLVIRPAWLPSTAEPGVLEIEIEPAGSFGLGDHPTTRLSADVTDRLVRPGDRVLDVGCGSGVLAVLAVLRGAEEAVAIDIAEAAREATVDNAARNGVGDRIDASTAGVDTIDGSFDLVLANILAPTLVALAGDLRRLTAPGGALVISGVLADHHDHVLDALAPMVVAERQVLDGWAAVVVRHG